MKSYPKGTTDLNKLFRVNNSREMLKEEKDLNNNRAFIIQKEENLDNTTLEMIDLEIDK